MSQHLRSAQPALKTLTSLPAPQQTAQMLVIEVGKKEIRPVPRGGSRGFVRTPFLMGRILFSV